MSDQPPYPPQQPGQPDPQGGQPQGPYPPQQGYYQQQPPPKKKRKVWPWVVIGLVILAFGGCVAAISGSMGGDKATVSSGGGEGVEAPADSGLTFQGKQERDTAANAGDAVTLDDVTTTTTPLFDATNPIGGSHLCTTVTLNNGGDKSANFSIFDWKLQDPAGASRSSTYTVTENQLSSGEVAPGGSATGDVCFDNPQGSPPGQYVVLLDPAFTFSSDRIGWINQR